MEEYQNLYPQLESYFFSIVKASILAVIERLNILLYILAVLFLLTGLIFFLYIFEKSKLQNALISSNQLLEKKVKERTSDLQNSNDQLEKEMQEREQLELELRLKSEALENSLNGFDIVDESARFVYVNKAYVDMWGYDDTQEILGTSLAAHCQDPETPSQIIAELKKNGSCIKQFLAKRKDGSVFDVLMYARLAHDENGREIYPTTSIDVTERKKNENAIKESEERFRALFEQAGGYCMILDPNTADGIPIIIDANKSACAAHGFTRDEFLGRPVADIDDEDGKRLVKKHTAEIMTGEPFYVENTHIRKDGTTFPVAVNAQRIDMSDGRSLILTTEYDITEQRKLEEQLRQAHKMEAIGTLAGGIAHDFNNILASVIGFAELSLDFAEKDSELRDNLDEIYSAGNRAKELIKQILLFSRQSNDALETIKPKSIIIEALRLLRPTIPTTIEIQQSLESNANIHGNAIQIHQIMMNLCTNAVHAMEQEGGILKVELYQQKTSDLANKFRHPEAEEYLVLKVSDTGIGIAADKLGSIFEPYYTTKEQGKGTGLGLSMVYGIVQRHEGFVDVESRVGQGTAFTIYLPVSQAGDLHENNMTGELKSGKERILFVDDEPQIAKLITRLLNGLGYNVTSVTNPVEAYELFRNDPSQFDLVISDVTMPKMPGHKLAQNIVKTRNDIPVILCTGYSDNIDQENIAEYRVSALMTKPLHKTELARIVRKVLDESPAINTPR
ncbi:PAS domain-containing sensor histidine kinase [Desulfopila sp. IMCC35008]|uniref:hybrid sensor histidine kinase/response regulator n=1 Tax=Desulfopila sp. IMCC35008 TaxID=2653858 RepID=UPI0027155E0C|nr:PAS domain-containing sensor histidine kinase [Desulfopila sp. IMCC35008]